MIPLMLALLAPALAGPRGDIQLRLFDPALDAAADLAETYDSTLAEPDLGDAFSCWDRVGVSNFNLDVPIDLVGLSPGQDTLTLYVGFGDITGAGMTLYGQDADWFDSCPEFSAAIHSIALRNPELVGTLLLEPDGAGFSVSWYSPPLFSADIESDIESVPDDLVLGFLEDTLVDLLTAEIEAALPPILNESLAQAAFQGDYDDYALDISLQDVQLQPGSLALGARTEVSFVGRPACAVPAGGAGPGGRDVAINLDDPQESAFGVGLTERFTNALLHMSWQSGAFCMRADATEALSARLAALVDPDILQIEAAASLAEPPVLVLEGSGMSLSLRGLQIDVTGRSDSGDVSLVSAQIDLDGRARVGFSPSLTAVTLSLSNLDLRFNDLSLGHIRPTFSDHIQPLLEEQIAAWLAAELQRIPMFSSLYYGLGYAIVVDRAAPVDGGLALWVDLLDPATVDQVAPETTIDAVEAGRSSARVAWSATDDQPGPLLWSYSLDGGAWSAFTEDVETELWGLDEGQHSVAVKARDTWLNEDGSPAEAHFTISQDNALRGGEGCGGCAGLGPRSAGLLGLLAGLTGLLARRRPGLGQTA